MLVVYITFIFTKMASMVILRSGIVCNTPLEKKIITDKNIKCTTLSNI